MATSYPTIPTWVTQYLKNQQPKYYNKTYDVYNPEESTYDPNAQTKYSGAENTAISKLGEIVQYGGYSPETKQSMLSGAMTPVYEEAEQLKKKAQEDAYARGLGQSSALSKSYGDIDRSTLARLAEITGGIEQQSAESVLPAIQQIQAGQQLASENEQFKAQLSANREQLKAQLSMSDNEMQVALDKINAALQSEAASREVQLTQIQNQFNLDTANLQLLIRQAQNEEEASKRDFWANLIGNIIGGGANVLGAVLGKK